MLPGRPTRRGVGAGLAALIGAGRVSAQAPEVDLALVLAIDCSYSVDASEFRLQMTGLGEALASAAAWAAIEKGPLQRIAVAVFQWSDKDVQRITEPWRVIATRAEAVALGQRVAQGRRSIPEGGTAISSALVFATALFALAPSAARQVIDVATDGRNNMGGSVSAARDQAISRGITINALAISNEVPTLDVYLEARVAGGPSHFVEKAKSYDDFGEAIVRKLVREITGPALT